MKTLVVFMLVLLCTSAFSQIQKEDSVVYTIVEEQPEYPGGHAELLKFFHKNLNHPSSCTEHGLSSSIFLKFMINKEGEAVEPVLIHKANTCPDLVNEWLRVFALLPKKWKPAKMNGKPVNCYYHLPMKFCPIK